MAHEKEKEIQTIQLARLFTRLDECRKLIYGDILPLCAHLLPGETEEVSQSLELSASAIDQFFKEYELRVPEKYGDE